MLSCNISVLQQIKIVSDAEIQMHFTILSLAVLLNDQSLESDLKELKAVHSSIVISEADTPKKTIIHVKDWHRISEEDYNSDKAANGADGLPATYAKFVESVRKVQSEQEAVLRMLRG